jgi:hypothetical protein
MGAMINGAGKQAIKNGAFLVTNSFALLARPSSTTITAPAGGPLNEQEMAPFGVLPLQKISNWPLAPKLSETER